MNPPELLQKMHPENTNVFANGKIKKHVNPSDDLENGYYANFVTGYVNVDTKDILEDDDIERYTAPVSNANEEGLSD